MTREEAMNELKKCIPSFNRKYIHWGKLVDKETDKSWLYKDEIYSQPDGERKTFLMPEVIPVDFLNGIKANFDDCEYVSVSQNPRKVDLSVTDYACYGNTHKYGTLSISGAVWQHEEFGKKWSTSSRRLSNIDPRVTGIWKVDLCKILSNEDLGEKGCDWEGYEANEATCRFSDIDELYCTAAYVALLRIEGDFLLTIDSYVASDPKPFQQLMKIEDGNVTFLPMLRAAKANILDEPF